MIDAVDEKDTAGGQARLESEGVVPALFVRKTHGGVGGRACFSLVFSVSTVNGAIIFF